jgi:hypothetical protein
MDAFARRQGSFSSKITSIRGSGASGIVSVASGKASLGRLLCACGPVGILEVGGESTQVSRVSGTLDIGLCSCGTEYIAGDFVLE